MDPDVLLRRLLDLARDVNLPEVEVASGIEAAEELAEGLADLDEWLLKGGFLPERWRKAAPRWA